MPESEAKKMIAQSAEAWANVEEMIRQAKGIIPLEKYQEMRADAASKASSSRNGFRKARSRTPTPPPAPERGVDDAEDALVAVLDDVANYVKASNE